MLAAVVGPTASGKSALGMALAVALGAEIVSVDSMQVYRAMDIGTAKPTPEEQLEVRHHLIDLVDPEEEHTVSQFQTELRGVLDDLVRRGASAILVGGTGLYFQAAVDGFTIPGRFPAVRAELDADPDTAALHRRLAELDPVAAARMEATNRRRVVRALEVTLGSGAPFSSFGPGVDAFPPLPFPVVALRHPRPALEDRIGARLRQQFEDGFLDEVRRLDARPGSLGRTAAQALGYRELLAHLHGGPPLDDTIELVRLRTRQFAVRQERWFRRDRRVRWLDAGGLPAGVSGARRLAAELRREIRP